MLLKPTFKIDISLLTKAALLHDIGAIKPIIPASAAMAIYLTYAMAIKDAKSLKMKNYMMLLHSASDIPVPELLKKRS